MLKSTAIEQLRKCYSFERTLSIIQITNEDGVYEDNKVKVRRILTPVDTTYEIIWKDVTIA